MKHGVYVIYDKVAEESGPMFEAVNNGVALRQACNVLKPLPPTLIDDYQLVKIGEYDTKDMQIYVMPPEIVDLSLSLARAREYDGIEVKINE